MKFFLFLLICISFNVTAEILTKEEKFYYDFFDYNKDGNISYQEANQILQLIFNLLDTNNDKKIDKDEILELKIIIESLS